MKKLTALMISDGRPGHYRQSEGVVAAMNRRRPVELSSIELRRRSSIPKGFVPKLAKRLPPSLFLMSIHGLDHRKLTKPDILISAGATTLGANVALARIWGIPNVFCGSTRGFPLGRFSLVLTPYSSLSGPPNVVAGPKPTPIDPDTIPAGRKLREPNDMHGARISILVGGPTEHVRYGRNDWAQLAQLTNALTQALSCRVTIVTSRRTPEQAYAMLAPLVSRPDGCVSLIDYRTEAAGSIRTAFDCDVILVTRDSLSMITEAALSRRPAIALEPEFTRPHRDDEAVSELVRSRLLDILPFDVTARDVAVTAAKLVPLVENHLDSLADAVDHHLNGVTHGRPHLTQIRSDIVNPRRQRAVATSVSQFEGRFSREPGTLLYG